MTNRPRSDLPLRLLQASAVVLVVKTTLSIVAQYSDYLPPNFRAHFLLGRQTYFYGAYATMFYAHIVTGPFCLLAGLLLLVHRFRERQPAWHRRLGKAHVIAVVAVLGPSGLWMARYAMTGTVAGLGFALLSLLTMATAVLGWRAAVRRRFDEHRRWMERLFAMLVSAVVLRVLGGASELLGWNDFYPITAWLSWLLPLGGLEAGRVIRYQSTPRQRSLASTEAFAGRFQSIEPGDDHRQTHTA